MRSLLRSAAGSTSRTFDWMSTAPKRYRVALLDREGEDEAVARADRTRATAETMRTSA